LALGAAVDLLARAYDQFAMKNSPVHWYEGLFLRPHHLQAADRYWTELINLNSRWNCAYDYGVYQFEFSKEALANHQIELHALKARMRDGTVVDLELGQEVDRVDLKQAVAEGSKLAAQLGDAFAQESIVRVYLAVPKLKLGRNNCSSGERDGITRFSEARLTIPDENRGGYEQQVQLRELNAKLLLSTQDLTGHELLPIAQIKRASEGEASPELDINYIPPVLSINSWPALGNDIVRALFDVIGRKMEVLGQQIIDRGIGRESQNPGDLDRISMLEKLNEAYASLSIIAFAQTIHPLVAYTELCRVLGQLSIFTPDRLANDIPAYDHEDLARIFREIKRRIEDILRSVRDYEFEQRYFLGVGLGMQASLESTWFNSNWEWCIGVKKGDLSVQECRHLLSPGVLDWKFGSSRQVENIFLRRAEGVQLRPLERAIRALPARQDWIYYEVLQNDSSAWRDVVATQTLGMRFRDSLILNKDQLQGEREILVGAMDRKVRLQFALFAIPQHQ
jgi:type VI secretion system protein ImpJ